MNLSRFAVRRPIFTIMGTLVVLILGGVSLTRLPIDLMPDITYPTLSIITSYQNASPEEIEELITRPIEEAVSAVPGVEEVTSTSAEGISQVRVTFTWGTDLDAGANDIRDRLDRILSRLPEESERPTLRKFDLASFPILILGASSDLDPIQMRRIIDEQVKYRIERLPGVAAADVHGGLDREIHVNLYPDKINALGLPLDQIMTRIKAENVNIPAGTLERGRLDVMVRTPGEYSSLEDLRDTIIAVRDGVPIRLKEVASVEDAWEKVTRIVRVNGLPGIRLAVNKQSGTNTVDVARGVLDEIQRINRDIPQINLVPIIDTSDYIQRSITNVGSTIFYGGALAVLILLFFLRSIRSTAVVVTAIPVSIVATFALMYFGGFTLNLMTLGGLALGVGMLVDNSIVVLENIFRMRESDVPADQAAVKGSAEVTPAIIASTLTTLAVFLPLVFMRGMSGIMYKQLSYVVGFALICSLTASLTVVPMLSARALRRSMFRSEANPAISSRAYDISGRIFAGLENDYKRLLKLTLKHRGLTIACAVLLLAGSLVLIPIVGVEFMPKTDEGEVRIYAEMAVGTRVGVVGKVFDKIEEVVGREVPEVLNSVAYIGGTSWRATGSHTGQLRLSLKPLSERSRSSEKIAAVLRRKLAHMPGVTIRSRAGQGLFLLRMGRTDSDQVEVEVRGHGLQTADLLAQQVKRQVEQVEGVTDVQLSRESGTPEELIMIDRQKAADMQLTVSQIANALQTVLSGTPAGNYRERGDEYTILVKLKDAERMDLEKILNLIVTNSEGQPVVLRNLVRVQPRSGPVLIQRKDQERIINVSANISGRDMGSVYADIRRGLRTIPLPQGFSFAFGGDYEEQQKSFRELALSFVLAIVLVYMVMASLYESLRDPFVVMFSVPLAAIGVIWILLVTHTTFNVQSYIGCIMLGGIVVNNAILLVDQINLLRRRDGMPLDEAIGEAGRRRLRPILMTAMTTIFALTPLALGLGEGSDAQAPMARTVIGGLLSSTLITLLFVPTIYAIFEATPKAKRRKRAADEKREIPDSDVQGTSVG